MKFGRIKRQHGRVGGLDALLDRIVRDCPHVSRIVPGRIKMRRGKTAQPFKVQYPTDAGLKCLYTGTGTVQEVFLICSDRRRQSNGSTTWDWWKAMSKPALSIETNVNGLRILIPMGTPQRLWLLAAATVIFTFGLLMSAAATFSLKHTGSVGSFWWLPLILSGLIVLMYIVALTVIWSIPPAVVTLDGVELSIGDDLNDRRIVLPRASVQSIRVSRLPMVPIGTMVIRANKQPPARAGYWRNRELLAAAERLRTAMGLRP